jgi:predicted small secreted protein
MKNTRISRLILILSLFAASFLGLIATGCKHTAHGAGQDIEQMGEKIQEKTQ